LTDAVWLTIGQLFALLAAGLAFIQSRANYKKQVEDNKASRAAIQEIHLTINSRLTEFKEQTDKLLAVSIAAAHAKGIAEGRGTK
jgi:hypothetical protein